MTAQVLWWVQFDAAGRIIRREYRAADDTPADHRPDPAPKVRRGIIPAAQGQLL